jgi:GNAT superfamily N-acetyltransferase
VLCDRRRKAQPTRFGSAAPAVAPAARCAEAVGVDVTVTALGTSAADAALCGLVYVRSWPTTAACTYSPPQIQARLVERGPGYWVDHLERSPVRFSGHVNGRYGFVLITTEPEGRELSYLFVEPEAFGTGLAEALYDSAMAQIEHRPHHAWIISCNERSLRFFTRRGWRIEHGAGQPCWADGHGHGHRYTRIVP